MATDLNVFDNLMTWCPYGALIITDGCLSAVNAEAAAIIGSAQQGMVGRPLEDLVASEHRPVIAQLLTDPSAGSPRVELRLARDLQPIELVVAGGVDSNRTLVLGMRSLAREFRLSALAHAELTHDPTTGLPNRLHLLSQLYDRLGGARSRHLALLGLWIDNLEGLSDERGDHAVSRVLREVSSRLQSRLRGPDLLGRLDDSGFLTVITSDTSTEQMKEIGGRLRDEVAFPVEFNDSLVSFTASVAVATIGIQRPTLDELVDGIDQAAARARSGQGSQTEVFSFPDDESSS